MRAVNHEEEHSEPEQLPTQPVPMFPKCVNALVHLHITHRYTYTDPATPPTSLPAHLHTDIWRLQLRALNWSPLETKEFVNTHSISGEIMQTFRRSLLFRGLCYRAPPTCKEVPCLHLYKPGKTNGKADG